MAGRFRANAVIIGFGLAFWAAFWADGAQLKVYPLRIALSPQEPVTAMVVNNGAGEPVLLQLQVMTWRQQAGEDVLAPTRDVLANPGIFQLAPGADQIARFGLRAEAGGAEAGDTERSYRVIVQEIPILGARKPGEVITLLRLSIPIFVTPPDSRPRVTWRVAPAPDQKIAVEVHDDGTRHVQITHLILTGEDGLSIAEQDLSTYVLPGASRRVIMGVRRPLKVGEAVHIKATTDQEPVIAAAIGEDGLDEPGGR